MLGDKCDSCGEEVLILKKLNGKMLCLDCYCKFKDDKNIKTNQPENNEKEKQTEIENNQKNRFYGDRRCPNCGRIIPFDSIICPYCGKRFETY